jgi:hypothetical protein
MIIGRGIVGITDEGVVFVEKLLNRRAARKVALKAVGQFVDVVPVGRILMLQFVENPRYPVGCSPNYGFNGSFETARHCILNGDICKLRSVVDMSDGGKADVVGFFRYEACESWVCWVFARFLNRYGWINDRCIERFDNALLDKGNEGEKMPDVVLFAGSEDGRLALFVPGTARLGSLPKPPFRVRLQSTNYWVQGGSPQIIEWETTISGSGLFLVWFGSYVLPFRAYYSYPAGTQVKPGFSGSNGFLV